MTSRYALMAMLLAAAALSGCGSSPSTRFYTLSAGAAGEAVRGGTPYIVAIVVATVPETVDRPQLVLSTSASQVTVAEFAQWAGPLKSEIPRVIAVNLTQLLDGAIVYGYPQGAGVNADCRVLIDVQRFDSALGDAATVELLWTVQPAKGAARSGRSVVRELAQGTDYDALVAAHSRALAAVSRDIANAIRASAAGGQ